MIEQYNDILTTIWIGLSVMVAVACPIACLIRGERLLAIYALVFAPFFGFALLIIIPMLIGLFLLNVIGEATNEVFKG